MNRFLLDERGEDEKSPGKRRHPFLRDKFSCGQHTKRKLPRGKEKEARDREKSGIRLLRYFMSSTVKR